MFSGNEWLILLMFLAGVALAVWGLWGLIRANKRAAIERPATNPYQKTPEQLSRMRYRAATVAFFAGIGLLVFGAYSLIDAIFTDPMFCNALGCVSRSNARRDDAFAGVLMIGVGAPLLWWAIKTRSEAG